MRPDAVTSVWHVGVDRLPAAKRYTLKTDVCAADTVRTFQFSVLCGYTIGFKDSYNGNGSSFTSDRVRKTDRLTREMKLKIWHFKRAPREGE